MSASTLDSKFLLDSISAALLVIAAIMYIALTWFDQKAPYGRYTPQALDKNYKGILLGWRFANVIKHITFLPGALLALYWRDSMLTGNIANDVLIAIPIIHYCNRSLLYPFRFPGKGTLTPLFLCCLAMAYCFCNGFLQVRYLSRYVAYPSDYCFHPHFIFGVLLWASGFALNIQTDNILAGLRKPGQSGYFVPRGGLYEYVSGANFFTEIIEWFGFAIAAWELPAFMHLVWTMSNVIPRAYHHHKWYLDTFKDAYPKNRKAFIRIALRIRTSERWSPTPSIRNDVLAPFEMRRSES